MLLIMNVASISQLTEDWAAHGLQLAFATRWSVGPLRYLGKGEGPRSAGWIREPLPGYINRSSAIEVNGSAGSTRSTY